MDTNVLGHSLDQTTVKMGLFGEMPPRCVTQSWLAEQGISLPTNAIILGIKQAGPAYKVVCEKPDCMGWHLFSPAQMWPKCCVEYLILETNELLEPPMDIPVLAIASMISTPVQWHDPVSDDDPSTIRQQLK